MRITVVAFAYRSENLHRLPWRHVRELTGHLSKLNHDIQVITDGFPVLPRVGVVGGAPVVRLRNVKHFPPRRFDDITDTIDSTDPDVILWLMGLTSFFQRKLFMSLKYPIVALVGSPLYWRREILRNIGVGEILHETSSLTIALAQALVPRFLIRQNFNLDVIRFIVVMSRENENRLESIGVARDKLVYIPPGVDPYFLQRPSQPEIKRARNEACEGREFLVTYFGPPLLTRGVDTLLRATKYVIAMCPSLKSRLRVLILSRRRRNEYDILERRMLRLSRRLNLGEVMKLESGIKTEDELKAYVAASDLIAMPFKHVVSDVPLGITEALSLGKAVVSTRVDGIPELLADSRGLVIAPGDFKNLGRIIIHLARNTQEVNTYGERARRYVSERPTWEETAHMLLRVLRASAKSHRT